MADIAKIDKNLAVTSRVEKENLVFYDIEQEPFRVYGVKKENGKYRRIPEEVARNISEGVYNLHTNTAGGRVRFVTDSEYIGIHVEIEEMHLFPHMPLSGVAGFDLYVREDDTEKYVGTFMPPYGVKAGYESMIQFTEKKERIITINFPLYSSLYNLYVGLDRDACLKCAPAYTYEIPVVYYGSSITQGGCASRPGNSYQNILTRLFDCDYLNLGFAGNAKAEDAITDWIKQLDMSVFVLDYDHNSPDRKHLQATHERMFKGIRESHPQLPIIIMSRPKYYLNQEEEKRLEIIRATYEHAIAAGDKNVYFIDSAALTEDIKDNGTVDNCHPTDSGFMSMARAIAPVLEKILKG